MNPGSCRFTRAAVAIFGQLQLRSRETTTPLLPVDLWAECERLHRLLSKAQQQRLSLAEQRLRAQLGKVMDRLNEQLATSRRSMDRDQPAQAVSTVHEILADLRSLQGEFDIVKVDMKRRTITVQTDTIELEGVVLGQFEIVLGWRHLGERAAYDVIAVDGSPAATSEDTTHPHVQSNSLCEGDGQAAIRNALSEGRLFDFFVLVRQILETYNSASAYVKLEDWHGSECPDCGRTMHDDDSSLCDLCSTTTCYECTTGCGSCDDRFCSDCIRSCPDCDNSTCSSCLTKCADCDDDFCKGCLDDELCSDCLARKEEEDDSERNPETTTNAAATAPIHSVQPVRVGEAAVPA
ncbi:MAG: hypothetical protein HQ518_01540 [Rhodopirellula sp.]|nr:hypothetical protein [Rhodopirellula sp.]